MVWYTFWRSYTAKKPLLSTMAKEVFSCILGKNSEIGLRSGQTDLPEPDFLCFERAGTSRDRPLLASGVRSQILSGVTDQ